MNSITVLKKYILLVPFVIAACGRSGEAEYAEEIAESSAAEIYAKTCYMCHNYGTNGAPKITDKAEWNRRLEARAFEGLVKNTIDGFNAMPARGMCVQCTDEQLAGLVKYMLAQ